MSFYDILKLGLLIYLCICIELGWKFSAVDDSPYMLANTRQIGYLPSTGTLICIIYFWQELGFDFYEMMVDWLLLFLFLYINICALCNVHYASFIVIILGCHLSQFDINC